MALSRHKTTHKATDTETPSVAPDTNEDTSLQRNSFTIRIPRFSFPMTSYTPLLVILLIVTSFLLGALTTKVSYLEKGGVLGVNANAAAPNAPAAPAAQQEPAAVDPATAVQLINAAKDPLPSLGAKDGKVTIVEFTDFQCPFCKRYFDEAYKEIKKDYVDNEKVTYVMKHYPLPFHQNAQKAGEASECANAQGGFWAYHDILFTKQTEWENLSADEANKKFGEYATEAGIDSTALVSCVEAGTFAQKVKDDSAVGTQAGVSGTPSIFVNGRIIVGAQPASEFKKVIDEELAK